MVAEAREVVALQAREEVGDEVDERARADWRQAAQVVEVLRGAHGSTHLPRQSRGQQQRVAVAAAAAGPFVRERHVIPHVILPLLLHLGHPRLEGGREDAELHQAMVLPRRVEFDALPPDVLIDIRRDKEAR